MASLPLEMGFTPGDLGNSIFRQPAICSRMKLRVSRVGVRLRPSLDSLSFLALGAVWVWVCECQAQLVGRQVTAQWAPLEETVVARPVTRLCLVFTLNSCTDLFSPYDV